jgi:surfactin synthase thioesterase subunit
MRLFPGEHFFPQSARAQLPGDIAAELFGG